MKINFPSSKGPITMDAIDTTSTDLVLIDADDNEVDTPGFGSEVAKTLAISTATSAVVFGGFVAIAALTPKVKTWFADRKKKTEATVEDAIDAANAKIDSLKTEKD
jgi:hypothetical protein